MYRKIICRVAVFSLLLKIPCIPGYSDDCRKPLIFPVPQNVELREGIFAIDKNTFIIVPEEESESDNFLAGLILNDFVDKFEQTINIRNRASFTGTDRVILAGDLANPLINSFCQKKGLISTLKKLGPEGYIIEVSGNYAVVAANTDRGALYGVESLRQIISKRAGDIFIPQIMVSDSPAFGFRGIKLYLPGRENIAFFKRFIKDFVALYKFNKIILELNANMHLDRHPELNIGAIQFARHLNMSRLDRPPGIHMEFQNSSHQDNADGGILEKAEVADLVSYMRKYNIEVIPELPSLTHSYYLLAGHNELAENLAQPYPDTYCPLKPEIYKIYFDVLDEYIDVIHPSMIHIGHDEWRMEKNLCDLCRGKDYGQLYADDVIKIHDYLAAKGIRTALWGDHLLESVTHKDHQEWESSTGYKYNIPGALTADQVMKLLPKDILVFNWFWSDNKDDRQISDFGFSQVYGNFTPDINNWNERVKTKGLLGGAPSSWASTNEWNFGKDLIYDFLGTANLLWSDHYIAPDTLGIETQHMISEIRCNLRGEWPPSCTGSRIIPLNISSHFNASFTSVTDSLYYTSDCSGPPRSGKVAFSLNISPGSADNVIMVSDNQIDTQKRSVSGIVVDRDVNSIIFLHSCSKAGKNEKAYRMIYNFNETSELLGWYDIIYEDGFTESVPLRYGVNILDCGWKGRIMNEKPGEEEVTQKYVYAADAVNCSGGKGDPVTFFSFEWKNTRPGKKIKAINLSSAGRTEGENAIMLLAVSITESEALIKASGTEKE
jgi:hypothetical protein